MQEKVDTQKKSGTLSSQDFEKARQALEKANVPGPVTMIVNTDTWSDEQWKLFEMMEEMAGAPKEEYGKRTPGERCMYEIQREETHRRAQAEVD